MAARRVCVLGAGVVGLSSAVRILEQCSGVEVTLLADKFSPHTTSDVSGGFWQPYCLGDTPQNLIKEWSSVTWDHLYRLFDSPDAGKVGCQMLSGYFLFEDKHEYDLDFKEQVLGYRRLSEEELSLFPAVSWGIFYTSLQIDVTLYLYWLMARFKRQGGKIRQSKVHSLNEITGDYDVVVNCTGMGAYAIMGDNSLSPVRGQVLRMKAPWIKHFLIRVDSEGKETYIFPGSRSVVVGGVAQRGNWNTDVDQNDSQDIHQRALSVLPSLKGAEIMSVDVGLRPARTSVRLEVENINTKGKNTTVVHSYGHGGAGVTLHWGCAQQVVRLVTEALARSKL